MNLAEACIWCMWLLTRDTSEFADVTVFTNWESSCGASATRGEPHPKKYGPAFRPAQVVANGYWLEVNLHGKLRLATRRCRSESAKRARAGYQVVATERRPPGVARRY